MKVYEVPLTFAEQYIDISEYLRPSYQVSVYRTIGPLVSSPDPKAHR